jgi:hypothetical protein
MELKKSSIALMELLITVLKNHHKNPIFTKQKKDQILLLRLWVFDRKNLRIKCKNHGRKLNFLLVIIKWLILWILTFIFIECNGAPNYPEFKRIIDLRHHQKILQNHWKTSKFHSRFSNKQNFIVYNESFYVSVESAYSNISWFSNQICRSIFRSIVNIELFVGY